MAPALVRYDSAGRISQVEAAEMAGSIPPLQAALAANKNQRKKPLWFTACIPTTRPIVSSTASSVSSGKDSPDSPRSALSEAPCHRLCSAEVCPLSAREPAPSHQSDGPPSRPAEPDADLHIASPKGADLRASTQSVPEFQALTPLGSPHSQSQAGTEFLIECAKPVTPTRGRSGKGLKDLLPTMKQLIASRAGQLKKLGLRGVKQVSSPVSSSQQNRMFPDDILRSPHAPQSPHPADMMHTPASSQAFTNADEVLFTPCSALDTHEADRAGSETDRASLKMDLVSDGQQGQFSSPRGKLFGTVSEASVVSISAIAIPNPVSVPVHATQG
jgi:hypothetical protein